MTQDHHETTGTDLGATSDAERSDRVASRVEEALAHTFHYHLADQSGQSLTDAQRREVLTTLFAEIYDGIGRDLFVATPVELLDQFSVMSVIKDHDTQGLLRLALTSFMTAYANPRTTDRAHQILMMMAAISPDREALDNPDGDAYVPLGTDTIVQSVLAEMESAAADDHHALPRKSASPFMTTTKRKLEVNLRTRFPEHTIKAPVFSVRFRDEDALVVLATRYPGTLPEEIDGVRVEFAITHQERL